jgi:acylpyruvate hydrolase
MRLLTYLEAEQPRPACLVDGLVIDIARAIEYHQISTKYQTQPAYLHFTRVEDYFILSRKERQHLWKIIQDIVAAISTPEKSPGLISALANLKLTPPILHPEKIICVGMNYPAEENASRPDYPVVFLKPANTLTATNTPIILATACQRVVYEAELAFYISQPCHNISLAEAKDCIGGYTITNDIGDSILEKRSSQWVSGKMFDTFTPVGPYLVTPEEVPDPSDLLIQTFHNGKLVQEANTSEMLFDVFEITSYLSTLTTLQPGDLILTGSPKQIHGQPNQIDPLQPGDRLKVVIDGLGELDNYVVKGE